MYSQAAAAMATDAMPAPVPVQGGTPYAVSMTPGDVTASKATVALLYHNTAGATNLESVRVRFSREEASGWETGVNSCTASYNPATNSVSLLNDAATAWLTGTLGIGTLTNSFNGTTLTLSWPAGAGWVLQWQTNGLNQGLGTNWVDVPGSDSINSTNITVDKLMPTVFFRLTQ